MSNYIPLFCGCNYLSMPFNQCLGFMWPLQSHVKWNLGHGWVIYIPWILADAIIYPCPTLMSWGYRIQGYVIRRYYLSTIHSIARPSFFFFFFLKFFVVHPSCWNHHPHHIGMCVIFLSLLYLSSLIYVMCVQCAAETGGGGSSIEIRVAGNWSTVKSLI